MYNVKQAANPMNFQTLKPDVVIFGGGISGLLTLHLLKAQGYQVILFEKNSLSSGQTILSQGIIHGGIKYALTGEMSHSAQSVSVMPAWWRDCLHGSGSVDLQSTQCLSEHYYLWSTQHWLSKFSHFVSKKLLQSDCVNIERNNYPTFFNHLQFKGNLFQAEEIVLDVPSLVKTLSQQHMDSIFLLPPERYHLTIGNDQLEKITINIFHEKLEVKSKFYVLAAGAGNHDFKSLLPFIPKMQLRPLHMIWGYPAPARLYGHCIDHHSTPRISITTHYGAHPVWYIGGRIAETGVNRNQDEQISALKFELSETLPWVNCDHMRWHTLRVDRAELMNPTGTRPSSFSLAAHHNILTAWPTKLTLAPELAQSIVEQITSVISPSTQKSFHEALQPLGKPCIAAPPWDDI